jgi:hypothetical protein
MILLVEGHLVLVSGNIHYSAFVWRLVGDGLKLSHR